MGVSLPSLTSTADACFPGQSANLGLFYCREMCFTALLRFGCSWQRDGLALGLLGGLAEPYNTEFIVKHRFMPLCGTLEREQL